jgi:four helix bundle protein
MQNFRRLRVSNRAQALATLIRKQVGSFPAKGFGDLRSQMVRAAESIFFNIAEGCGSSSPREFARFLSISSKSTLELESQIELAKGYRIISPEESDALMAEVSTVRKMLWGLRARLLASADAPTTDTDRPKTENA